MTGVKGVGSHSGDSVAKSILEGNRNKENFIQKQKNEQIKEISSNSIPINGHRERRDSLAGRKLSITGPGKLQGVNKELGLGKNRSFGLVGSNRIEKSKLETSLERKVDEHSLKASKLAIDNCLIQLKNHNTHQTLHPSARLTTAETQIIQDAITQKITGNQKSTIFKLATLPNLDSSKKSDPSKEKEVWVSFNKTGEPKLIILYQNVFLTSGGMSDVYHRGSWVEKIPKFNEAALEDVNREAKTIQMLKEKYPDSTSFIDATLIQTETGPHLLVELMDGGDLTKIGLGVFHDNIEKMEKFANTFGEINKLGTDLKAAVEGKNYTVAKEKIEAIRHHINTLKKENLPVECSPYNAKDLSTMLDKLKTVETKLNDLKAKDGLTPSLDSSASFSSTYPSTSTSSSTSISPSSSTDSLSSSSSANSLNPDTPRGISAINNLIEKDFCKKALDLKQEMKEGIAKGNKVGKTANSPFNPEKLNKKKLYGIARNVLEGHVLMGMAGLHHRDIKLENILVKLNDAKNDIDYIRLADFGTASTHSEVDIGSPVEGTKLYTSQNGANQLGDISQEYRALIDEESKEKKAKLLTSQIKQEAKIDSLEKKIGQRELELLKQEKSLARLERKEGGGSLSRFAKLKVKVETTKAKLARDQKSLESEKQKLSKITKNLVALNKNTAAELFNQYNNAVAKEDVYALGVTLFQVLTQGRYPYGEVYSSGASAQRFKEKDNPYRSEILENLGYPKELNNVIKAMVDHDPKNRPSFSELNAVFQGLPRSL